MLSVKNRGDGVACSRMGEDGYAIGVRLKLDDRCLRGDGVDSLSNRAFMGGRVVGFLAGLFHEDDVLLRSSEDRSKVTSAPESPMAMVDRSVAAGVEEASDRGMVTIEAGDSVLRPSLVGVCGETTPLPPFQAAKGWRIASFVMVQVTALS